MPRSIPRLFRTSNVPNRTISVLTTAVQTRLVCHPVEQTILVERKILSVSTHPLSAPWPPRPQQLEARLRQPRADQLCTLGLEAHPRPPARPMIPVKHRLLPLELDVPMVSSLFLPVSSAASLSCYRRHSSFTRTFRWCPSNPSQLAACLSKRPVISPA